MSRIFLIEDHPAMRLALATVVKRHGGWTVCGEADQVDDALRLIAELLPDAIMVDLLLPGGDGIELIKKIKSIMPEAKMIVVSAMDPACYGERALRAGAMGYISKTEEPDVIERAIEKVLCGGFFLGEDLQAQLVKALADRDPFGRASPVALLSDRELQTFELLGAGQTTRAIAKLMNVSVKTVDAFRQRIKTKLHITTSNELIRRASQWALQSRTGHLDEAASQ